MYPPLPRVCVARRNFKCQFYTFTYLQNATEILRIKPCTMNQLVNLLHDSLISTGHVENCGIVRRNDASLRANSVGFVLSPAEIHAFISAFKNPAETRERGIRFGDDTYDCVRADKFSIYAKQGSRGLVIVRTATLLLIGTYSQDMYSSVCVEALEKLADYFREKGK